MLKKKEEEEDQTWCGGIIDSNKWRASISKKYAGNRVLWKVKDYGGWP